MGVLALQGDVREHTAALADLGEPVRAVRTPDDLTGLDGVVIPGGESTTLSMLVRSSGLFRPLLDLLDGGLPVFGTCAGMILLAGEVLDGRGDQQGFGLVDLTVRRNGYGRQAASFECDLEVIGLGDEAVHAVFIRAPVVERAGPAVEVLSRLPAERSGNGKCGNGKHGRASEPVVCRQGSALVTSFHPELTGDRRLHRLFVEMTKVERR
ncbi:MAG: pyridoxal 5'-phosphate synthase glutaminase subunit PdxT [Acidimicrobiales bacterium]